HLCYCACSHRSYCFGCSEPSALSRQQANALLDKRKQILVALNQDIEAVADPASLYMELSQDTVACGNTEVYVFSIEGATKYVLRLHGQGLWGGIGGYLALDEDKNTVFGVNFNHEGETPGLGAEITNIKFRQQFVGKHIKDATGAIRSIAVLKVGKMADQGQEQVDAWAGATITSTGVSDMLAANLAEYAEFLNNVPVKEVPATEENVEPIVEEKEE
ncbi:MAG: FMN-binding protein, partial [Bacteroidales bacterium]|nr:FMN-binding protein [Candidatus Colicola coprequi]